MKIFKIILSVLAVIFIVINFTKLNFNNLLGDNSSVIAFIGIISGTIVLLLLLILKKSTEVKDKLK